MQLKFTVSSINVRQPAITKRLSDRQLVDRSVRAMLTELESNRNFMIFFTGSHLCRGTSLMGEPLKSRTRNCFTPVECERDATES